MKITLCGSIAFINEMDRLRVQLEGLGHEVKMPPTMVPGETGELIPAGDYYNHKKSVPGDGENWIWKHHSERIAAHFRKVEWAESIIVANYDKNGIPGYIGPNTLMEMGLAFHFNKKIFLINPIPEISYKEEILGMKPIILDNNLGLIR